MLNIRENDMNEFEKLQGWQKRSYDILVSQAMNLAVEEIVTVPGRVEEDGWRVATPSSLRRWRREAFPQRASCDYPGNRSRRGATPKPCRRLSLAQEQIRARLRRAVPHPPAAQRLPFRPASSGWLYRP